MLVEAGHEICLYERFSSPRPVGSGIILQPTGLAVLRELGLEASIHKLGQRIDRIHGVSMPAGREVLNVDYSALGDGYHGLAVHRAALFDVLYEQVRSSSVLIKTAVEIVDATAAGKEITLWDANGESRGTFELVVDASGAGSRLSHRAIHPGRSRELAYGALWGSFDWPAASFAANTLEQRYVGAHTMIGVLPIGRHAAVEQDQVAFFWSIKSREYDAWLDRGLAHWKREVLAIWPETQIILDQVNTASDMTLARYGHCTLRTPYGDNIAILGDAAHSTSPQLGQGANMALLDAWSLAEALRGSDDVGSALRNYAASRRWHVRAFQLSSLLLTPFYQSDSRVLAALRDLLFDPVAKLPLARRIVAGLISGMLASPPKRLQV
tara:strand:- start:396 stop:1541 length:1146 start_codon:yes stop_codon:yes gene_type:complete